MPRFAYPVPTRTFHPEVSDEFRRMVETRSALDIERWRHEINKHYASHTKGTVCFEDPLGNGMYPRTPANRIPHFCHYSRSLARPGETKGTSDAHLYVQSKLVEWGKDLGDPNAGMEVVTPGARCDVLWPKFELCIEVDISALPPGDQLRRIERRKKAGFRTVHLTHNEHRGLALSQGLQVIQVRDLLTTAAEHTPLKKLSVVNVRTPCRSADGHVLKWPQAHSVPLFGVFKFIIDGGLEPIDTEFGWWRFTPNPSLLQDLEEAKKNIRQQTMDAELSREALRIDRERLQQVRRDRNDICDVNQSIMDSAEDLLEGPKPRVLSDAHTLMWSEARLEQIQQTRPTWLRWLGVGRTQTRPKEDALIAALRTEERRIRELAHHMETVVLKSEKAVDEQNWLLKQATREANEFMGYIADLGTKALRECREQRLTQAMTHVDHLVPKKNCDDILASEPQWLIGGPSSSLDRRA